MSKKQNVGKNKILKKFLHNPKGMIGLAFLVIELLLVVILPIVQHLDAEMVYEVLDKAPSQLHPLGLDNYMQDVYAKLLIGGRVSLTIGVGAALVSMLIGIPMGLIAGYHQGQIGRFINRLAEAFMCFPAMVLLLVLIGIFSKINIYVVILVLGGIGWPGTEKMLYASALSVSQYEYIQAARALGKKDWKIMMSDVLPNAITPVLVNIPFRVSMSIMTEAALSFLGMGVSSGWGKMINAAMSMKVMTAQLWMWLPPAICLVATVMAINFLGEGVRDACDQNTI